MVYDVIIIGGGASGILAAVAARKNGAIVLLIEKNKNLGKKMLISGGGRCNLTNNTSINNLVENIPDNGRFMYSALTQFSNKNLIDFFEYELNIKTKVEDNGRVFPISDDSKTLVNALSNYLDKLNVKLLTDSTVKNIFLINDQIKKIILNDGQTYKSKAVILATGGVTFPKTGSTGDGHRIAKELGHNITELFPSSVPLISNDKIIKKRYLQGLSLKDVEIILYNSNNKKIKGERGDLIFTHYGLSGPAILRISRNVHFAKKKDNDLYIEINLFPNKTNDDLKDIIYNLIKKMPSKILNNGLQGIIPDKILNYILSQNKMSTIKMSEISKEQINILVELFQHFKINITGTRDINEAFLTGGGVNLKEINPKTFESKKSKGVFIVGELLALDAFTGGYNLQVAFSSGYVAGISASEYSLNR